MGKYKVLDIFSFLPANVISLEELEKDIQKEKERCEKLNSWEDAE